MPSRKSRARDRARRRRQLAAGALVGRGQPRLYDPLTTNSPGPVPLEQLLPPLLPFLSPTTCSSLLQSSKGGALLVLLHAPHAKLILHGEVTHRRLRALRALLPGLQHLGLQGCRFTGIPADLKQQAFLLCFTMSCLTSMLFTVANIWAVTLALVAVLFPMFIITGCVALSFKIRASSGIWAVYDTSYCIVGHLLGVAATGFTMSSNTSLAPSLFSTSSPTWTQHIIVMCLLLPPCFASIVSSSREVGDLVVRKWLGGRCFYLRPPRPSSSWPMRSLTCTGCTPLGSSLHAALSVVDATQLQVLTTDDARVCTHLDQLPALQRLTITLPPPPASGWSAEGMGPVTDTAFQRLLLPHPSLRAVSLEGLDLQQDHTHSPCHWEELTLINPTLGQLGHLPLNSIPRCVVRGGLTMGHDTTAFDDDAEVLAALSGLEANPRVIFEPTTGLQAFGLAPDERGFVLNTCRTAFAAHLPRCIALCTKGGWSGVLVLQDCLLISAALACYEAPLPTSVSAVCLQGCGGLSDDPARLFSYLPAHVVRLVVKGIAEADPAVTY